MDVGGEQRRQLEAITVWARRIRTPINIASALTNEPVELEFVTDELALPIVAGDYSVRAGRSVNGVAPRVVSAWWAPKPCVEP